MRISLIIQNEITNVQIQTETNAAAQVLSESEVRLAQLMEASGMKFGSLTSQFNQNFSGQNTGNGHQKARTNSVKAGEAEVIDSRSTEISVGTSENLINMQA